jgi:hypothetical protein
MKVFTTINPNDNFESQNEALLSWFEKFEVYSVNTSEEIDKIKEIYPYVKFVETTDTYEYKNKKLIKLNSILDAIKKTGEDRHFCIVNSDIILSKKNTFSKILNDEHLNNGIVISTRYEIDENDKITHPFVAGYDVFIFDIKNIDILYNDKFVIGMPWWDYWVPSISLKYLLNIYHIKNKVFFHRTHETNYNHESWVIFGEHLYRELILNIMNKNIEGLDINTFCEKVKENIVKNQINIKI